MARIIVCDYLKRPMRSDEPTFVLSVDGKEFEVCQEARDQLIALLEADELPTQPQIPVVEKEVPAPIPVVAAPLQMPQLINVETEGDAFDPEMGGMELHQSPPAASGSAPDQPDEDDLVQLEIPANPNRRLPMGSEESWQKIMKQARKFEEGTLSALTPGAGRKTADKRLRKVEEEQEENLRRQGGSSINVNDNYRSAPEYRREE